MKTGLQAMGLILTAIAISNTALGQNLITSCKSSGGSVRGCRVPEKIIVKDACYEVAGVNECPDLDVNVKYNFACSGLDLGIVVASANGTSANLTFGKGTARLSGVRSPIVIKSPNPSKTAFATVNPSCSLRVVSTEVSPSFTALTVWGERARTHIAALNGAIRAFELTVKLEDLERLEIKEINAIIESILAMMDSTLVNGNFPDGLTPFQDSRTGDLIPVESLSPDLKAKWNLALKTLPQLLDFANTISQLQALRDNISSPSVSEEELLESTKKTQAILQRTAMGDLQIVLENADAFAKSMARINDKLKQNSKVNISELDRLLVEGRGLVEPIEL